MDYFPSCQRLYVRLDSVCLVTCSSNVCYHAYILAGKVLAAAVVENVTFFS